MKSMSLRVMRRSTVTPQMERGTVGCWLLPAYKEIQKIDTIEE